MHPAFGALPIYDSSPMLKLVNNLYGQAFAVVFPLYGVAVVLVLPVRGLANRLGLPSVAGVILFLCLLWFLVLVRLACLKARARHRKEAKARAVGVSICFLQPCGLVAFCLSINPDPQQERSGFLHSAWRRVRRRSVPFRLARHSQQCERRKPARHLA